MRRHLLTPLTTVSAALAVAACGSNASPVAQVSHPTVATGNTKGLTSYVLYGTQETGFSASGAITTEASDMAWAQLPGLPPRRTNLEATRLRAEGFVGGISQNLTGTAAPAEGVSTVARFKTPAGAAAAQLQLEQGFMKTYKKHTIVAVAVPSIPGAQATSVKNRSGYAVRVVWTEGDCVLSITNSSSVDQSAPAVAAAGAIYTRTGGKCT